MDKKQDQKNKIKRLDKKPSHVGKKRNKTMSSILDKIAKVQAARPASNNGGKTTGVFYNFKEGKNRIRLVGEFVEVRTHFIAPNVKQKKRGVCMQTAFAKSKDETDTLTQVVNCQNWDLATERVKPVKTCPVCKLNAIAKEFLSNSPTAEEKKFFEAMKDETKPSIAYKWNIIDRDDPYVVSVSDAGVETKVLGLKIASIGREAYDGIADIFKQVGYDIADPEKGIDIEVEKDSKSGPRVTYSARAVIEGITLKVTPFTADEKKLVPHDLRVRCGKQTAVKKIVDAFHDDYKTVYDTVSEDGQFVEEASDPVSEAIAEAKSATKPSKTELKKPVVEEDEDAIGEDEDDMIAVKKK